MNANPPPRPRFSSRPPPPRRATARRGRPGGLPRFTTGSARDAINLRWNYKDAINLATGEWTRTGYRAPACYVTNARPIVHATFSAAPADLPSVTLLGETDAAIGGFAATNVAFAAGAASDVALSTQSTTTNCILKESFDLTWKAVVSNGTEVVTNVIGKTDGHVLYTILGGPKLPWTDSIVGTNLPDHVKAFLRAQEVQIVAGEFVELPVNWLRVGHVDEVMAILPKGNGSFSVAVPDTSAAISLLTAEREAVAEQFENGDEELEDYLNFIDVILQPFLNPARQASLSIITNRLAEIRSVLKNGLGITDENIVSFPVLFTPTITTNGIGSLVIPDSSNPMNLVSIVSHDERRRIIIPDPIFDSLRARICDNLVSNGFPLAEIRFVRTKGPHDASGEAHCGSNALRRREP